MKNKVKISHEVPISLLEKSLQFNDYDYSLVHMLVENEEYYNFYKKYAKNREQILDNSAYELNDAFSPSIFAKYVEDIQPSYYIIPDKIGDYQATMDYFRDFTKEYSLPGKKIGVVQGTNYDEFIDCFKFMNEYCDKVAIPFHSPFYNTLEFKFNHNQQYTRMHGRIKAINILKENNLISKPIHLLGCSLPQEFYYIDNNIIESIDTSNPVALGLEHKNYHKDDKMNPYYDEKPANMINYEYQTTYIDEMYIFQNIFDFKKIIK